MKNKISLPKTNTSIRNEMLNNAKELNELINDLTKQFKILLHDEFINNKGCTICNGRGFVVTWDTMDSMTGCYAEFGSCPNKDCTDATRKVTGLDASTYSKYDRNRGISDPFENSVYFQHVEKLIETAQKLETNSKNVRTHARKGDDVVVVKGRKTPVGTTGRVFWIANQPIYVGRGVVGGTKCGIQPAVGEVQWTYLENVEIIAQ